MKTKILLIALLLLTVGSFAQTESLISGSEIKFREIFTNPKLHFGSTNGGFTIDFKNDSMIVKSEIPMNEAGMLLAKFSMQYYTHYTDSLKTEIELLKIRNKENRFTKILKDMFDELEKQWLSEQKKELKAIIKCGYQDQH